MSDELLLGYKLVEKIELERHIAEIESKAASKCNKLDVRSHDGTWLMDEIKQLRKIVPGFMLAAKATIDRSFTIAFFSDRLQDNLPPQYRRRRTKAHQVFTFGPGTVLTRIDPERGKRSGVKVEIRDGEFSIVVLLAKKSAWLVPRKGSLFVPSGNKPMTRTGLPGW